MASKVVIPEVDLPEDELQRLLLQDSIRDTTLHYMVSTIPLPEPPGLGESFLHGFTFGLVGDEPETLSGKISSFAGELTSFALLDMLAGLGLGAAGVRATTRLGRIALEGVKGAGVGGVVSAITPEHDPYLPFMYGALGSLFGVVSTRLSGGIPELEKVVETPEFLKAVREPVGRAMPETTEQAVRELFKTVSLPPREIRTPFDDAVLRLNTVMGRFQEKHRELYERASNEITRFLYGTDTDTAHVTAGIRQAFKEVDRVLGKAKRPFTNEEIKLFEELLIPNRLIDRPALREYLNRQFLKGRLKVTADKSVTNFDEITKLADTLNRRLARYEQAVELGVSPNAPVHVLEKRARKVYDFIQQKEKEILSDPELKALIQAGRQAVTDLITHRDTGTTLSSDAIKEALGNLGVLLGKNPVRESEEAIKTLLRASETQKVISEKIERHIKRVFTVSPDVREETNQIISGILSGGDIPQQKLTRMRKPLLDYITNKLELHIDTYLPDDLQQIRKQILDKAVTGQIGDSEIDLAKQLDAVRKEFARRVLTDPKFVERIARDTGDNEFRLAYELYRLSFGDQSSLYRIQALTENSSLDIGKRLGLRNVILEDPPEEFLVKAPEKTPPSGTGTPPPEIPSGQTPAGTGGGGSGEAGEQLMRDLTQTAANIRNDVGFFGAYFRTPYLYLNEKAKKSTGEYKTLYESARDWTDKYYRARLQLMRDVQEGRQKVSEWLTKLESDKETGSAVMQLIQIIDRHVNARLEQRASKSVIQNEVSSILAKQSQKVRDLYNEFRQITDWMHAQANSTIEFVNREFGLNLPKVEYRIGWIPYLYEGDYFLYAKDSAGRVRFRDIIFVDDITNGEEVAFKRIKQFLDAHPNFNGTIHLKPRLSVEPDDSELFGGFIKDFDAVFGVEARQLRQMLQEGKFTPKTVSNVFYGHALPRFYSWEERRIPLVDALHLSMINTLRFKNFLPVVKEGAMLVKKANSLGLQGLASYITEYQNHMLGRAGTTEKLLDKAIGDLIKVAYKVPGVRSALEKAGIQPEGRHLRSVVNTLTFLNRLTAIGFNIGTAMLNPILIATNLAPVIGIRNTVWAITKAPKIFLKKPPVLEELIRESGTDLILGTIGFRDTLAKHLDMPVSRLRHYMNVFDRLGMFMFNTTEEATRGVSLLGAYRHADQIAKRLSTGVAPKTWQEKLYVEIAQRRGLPLASREVKKAYAIHIMENTNFVYDISQLAALSRITPLRPFMQFKTFFMKEIEFLFGLGKQSKIDLLKSLGIFTAIGGVMGLPGVNELDALARLFTGFSPKEWAYINMPEFAVAGIGTLWGTDLSTRAGIGDISFFYNTGDIWSFGGAFPSRIKKSIDAYFRRGRPDQALRVLTPSVINSLIDTMHVLSGKPIRDPFSGNIAVLTPDEMNFMKYFFRLAGFPTIEETRFQAVKRKVMTQLNRFERERNRAISDYLDAIEHGNFEKAREIMTEHKLTARQVRDALRRRGQSQTEYLKGRLPKVLRGVITQEEMEKLLQ